MRSRVVAALAGLGLSVSLGAAEAQIRLDRPVGGGQQQPAQPQGGLITSVTSQQLLGLLRPAGWEKGEVLSLQGGTKAIKADLNGTPVFALLQGCEGENCASFAFFVFFGKQQVNANFINAFNRDRRFGKLYLDKEGALSMTMDVHLLGGVSPGYVAASGALFGSAIKWLVEFRPD